MICMKLQDAFNETRTDNGDRAYNSTKNDYLDVIFSIEKLKKTPKETPVFLCKNGKRPSKEKRWNGSKGTGKKPYGSG